MKQEQDNTQLQQKKALCFAHKGEALEFLRRAKPVPELCSLWESENYFIFIIGEDSHLIPLKISELLYKFRHKISSLYNLGICGGVNSKLIKNKLYQIRTSYAEDAFKSFTAVNENVGFQVDCITAKNRVLDKSYAQKLSGFADVVDREAWYFALACEYHNISYHIYKMISDIPIQEDVSCDLTKQNASEFSTMLFAAFEEAHQAKNLLNQGDSEIFKLLNDENFHFTKSLENKLRQMITKLHLNGLSYHEIMDRVEFNKIRQFKITSKVRSMIFISELEKILNPIKYKISEELRLITDPLNKNGIQVQFDPNYENHEVQITFSISNEEQLRNKISNLEAIQFKKISKILDGDVNV